MSQFRISVAAALRLSTRVIRTPRRSARDLHKLGLARGCSLYSKVDTPNQLRHYLSNVPSRTIPASLLG